MNTIKANPGETLFSIIDRGITTAISTRCEVKVEINGLLVRVYPESCHADIAEKLSLQQTINRMKERGEE